MKKTMYKLLALLLAFVLVVGTMPLGVFAADLAESNAEASTESVAESTAETDPVDTDSDEPTSETEPSEAAEPTEVTVASEAPTD